MDKEIKISDSEWKIMELFWTESMLTIGEIKAKLDDSGWSESTIKTLVRRLVEKNAVAKSGNSGKFIFYPLVSKEECIEYELNNIVNTIFSGSVNEMLLAISSSSLLSQETSKALYELAKSIK